ncbi:MAG: hypothetical protein NC926_10005 [Candidatus Omnitrophica bacterium]|nr:hypothetical protein [Candidatus Omnitrophota bacterium]
MKCDLCNREKDVEIITRKMFNITYIGFICSICKKNFYDFPNKIILDYSGKYWYISDERKFFDKAGLTFAKSLKQAFMEFNPRGRVFTLKTGEKVAYYWLIERGKSKFKRTYSLEGLIRPLKRRIK